MSVSALCRVKQRRMGGRLWADRKTPSGSGADGIPELPGRANNADDQLTGPTSNPAMPTTTANFVQSEMLGILRTIAG